MTQSPLGIVDTPLPDYLNYALLKEQAIADLKQLTGDVWTNYNESDPGVTILDQLVYALTELGYCADFPVADVLTSAQGKINYTGQFYLPQNILTTAPITADDYRRLVLDSFPTIQDVYIVAEQLSGNEQAGETQACFTGGYHTYIYLPGQNSTQNLALRYELQRFLTSWRNVGEFFYLPKHLTVRTFNLLGKATLASDAQVETVAANINTLLGNFATPQYPQAGYAQLMQQGLALGDVFNGPHLHNGWFAQQPLAHKITNLDLNDLAACLLSVPGIVALEDLQLSDLAATANSVNTASTANTANTASTANTTSTIKSTTSWQIHPDEIVHISLAPEPKWQLRQNLAPVAVHDSNAEYLTQLQLRQANKTLQSRIELLPPLPQGRYRDIETYYSVQNTFPNMYGVGQNSLQSDAPIYRIAQSKQLKAYLLLFDQLLANEFSQLAHAAELFSFSMGAAPVESNLHNPQTLSSLQNLSTYFAQPLYAVPDVMPLLKGVQAFNFEFSSHETPEQLQQNAWRDYQRDGFNPYCRALQSALEPEHIALERRDKFLNHLWARQGEDARIYEDMFKACQWYDSELKTRIVVKTLWLQNLPILAYFSATGARYQLNKPLQNPGRFLFARHDYQRMCNQWRTHGDVNSLEICIGITAPTRQILLQKIVNVLKANKMAKPALLPILKSLAATDVNKMLAQAEISNAYPPRINGQLDTEAIYLAKRINSADLQLYSGFELKLGILLGLHHYLRSMAGKLACLLQERTFNAWLMQAKPQHTYTLAHADISVLRQRKKDEIFVEQQKILEIRHSARTSMESAQVSTQDETGFAEAKDYQDHLDQLYWLSEHSKGFLLCEHGLLPGQDQLARTACEHYALAASLVLPAYVTFFNAAPMRGFIDNLVALHWPLHVRLQQVSASYILLKKLISARITWINTQPLNSGFPTVATQQNDTKTTTEASDPQAAGRRQAALTMAKLLGLPSWQVVNER